MVWIELISNLALLIALSVVSGFIDTRWKRNSRAGVLLQGVVFGGAAVIGMLRPFVFVPGLVFDGRSVMVSLGGLFFGPWTAAVGCLMTIPLRLAQGGPGAAMGVLVILSSALIGVVFHRRQLRKSREIPATTLLSFGVLVHLAMLAMTAALPPDLILPVLKNIGWPVMLAYPLATVLIGKILSDQVARHNFLASLQASEERYRELIEHVNSAIVRISPDGTVLFLNEFAQRFFGYTPAEILGRNIVGTIVPATATAGTQLAAVMRDMGSHPERCTSYENENMRKDGTRCWLAWRNQDIRDEQGRCVALLCAGTDITERRRAESALQREQLFSEKLLDSLPGIFYLYSYPELRLVRWNRNHETLLGFGAGEIKNRHLTEWHLPEAGEAVRQAVSEVMEKGQNTVEALLLTKAGQAIPFLLTGVRFEEQGRTYLMGVGVDITERKRAEEALRRNEAQQRAMVANITDVIAIIDQDGINRYKSPNIEKWFGWRPEEVVGVSTWDNIHPEDLESARKVFGALLKEPNAHGTGECRYKCKEGHYKWIEFTGINLVHDADIRGVLLNYHDLTAHKRAAAEKAKLEAQFQQAQKMESVGRLAGGVAHDFNNMLQAILGNAALALEEIPPVSPARESLEEIQKAALRSADLTRQLLAFARRQTIAPKVLDLNEAVEGLLKMLRRLIGEDIHLAWLPAADLGPVKVDPTQIDQILANLCVNARDAIDGVGKVTIETGNAVFDEAYCADHPGFVPGEYVRLAVSDDGRGMDKETQAHLFEPFFTTKGVGEGTGLGLATIYGIVKQNHGFVHVYSEPGQGTTFRLYLPRHAGQAAATRTEPARALPRSSGETVLLVEDEPAILAIARKVLARLGYTVLTARTPGEAIGLAETPAREIHLLMTDVVMPEMNGRDLARRILSIHPKLKCLFMSGYTANVIAHHGVLDEGVHFIQKPFSMEDLAAKVRQALRE